MIEVLFGVLLAAAFVFGLLWFLHALRDSL